MSLESARAILQGGLSDERLWGKAASVESQRSAGYEQRYGSHLGDFEAGFTSEVGGKRRVDPEAFRALSESGDAASSDVLKRTIESARATADTARKFGKHAEADRLQGAIRGLEKSQAQSAAVRAASGAVSRETTGPEEAQHAALGWLAQNGAGGSPGAVDAATGRLAARDGVFRGARAMSQASSDGLRSAADRLLSGRGPDTEAEPTASSSGPLVTLDTFDGHRDHVEKMSKDPDYFASVMADRFGQMPEAAPEVYGALSQQAAKVAQYLTAVAPGGSSGGPFGRRLPVGEDELWEYNERLRAIAEPAYIHDAVATGRASAAAIEAFGAIYPKQYEKLRMDVFERLGQLKAQGVQLPIDAREQLDTMLDIDGGGEPALTWKVAERAYAATARKNSAPATSGQGGDEHASAMTSGALSTLSNGASAIAQTG